MQSDPISVIEQYLQQLPAGLRGPAHLIIIAIVIVVAATWLLIPFAAFVATMRLKRTVNRLDSIGATAVELAAKLDALNKVLQDTRALQATWFQDPLPMAAKARLDRITALIDGIGAKLDLTNKELQDARKLRAAQTHEPLQVGATGRFDRMVNRLDAIGATLHALNRELQETGTLQTTPVQESRAADTNDKIAPPR